MKEMLKMINPFKKDVEHIQKELYVIKKLLGFIVVYIASMFIGEFIVILGLVLAGYDFLHGDMPSNDVMMLVKYYGFSIHMIVTILYCKFIEKRTLQSMGIVKKKIAKSYLIGMGIAIILIGTTLLFSVVSGAVTYKGKSSNVNWVFVAAYLGGFAIQGAMEELMCRGFLMNSLLCKVSKITAILVSSLAFAFPHFSTLFATGLQNSIIGVFNLFLFSAIVSLLMIKYKNIWVSCAVHSIWNFILAIIIGINVSGAYAASSIYNFNAYEGMKLFSGGQYGIEAGLICTIVLVIFVTMLVRKDKRQRYGI